MKKVIIIAGLAGLALNFSQQAGAGATADWTRCGVHGGICENHGTSSVRYGFDGNWVGLEVVKGSIDCLPQMFQNGVLMEGDPFSSAVADVDKRCEVR